MITIFSSPKPFKNDHINNIQTNAIRSWTLLKPTPEIILFGKEKGIAEISNEFNICHIEDIRYNKFGTPYLDSIFSIAQELATNEIVCYINSDIILQQDFLEAVQIVRGLMDRFLIVGQRWDLDLAGELDFNSPNWAKTLTLKARRNGILHDSTAIDFFAFPSKNIGKFPPFFLGRRFWDHWFIWRVKSLNIPIIDITSVAVVIHQNHTHNHIAGGFMYGPEALWNKKLGGKWLYRYDIYQSSYELTAKGLRRKFHPLTEPFLRILHLFYREGLEFLGYFLPLNILRNSLFFRKIHSFLLTKLLTHHKSPGF
ncbi:MAG: hypothetical protein ACFFBD_00370 [Candidatus Hodarchaeota archaeon]